MKYKNFNEWYNDSKYQHYVRFTKEMMLDAWDAAVKQCTEIAKGHKCQLGRSDHEDQQDMTATLIMREIEEIK